MTATYDVWDDETGNVVARFEAMAEAEALLLALSRENGPGGVRTLSIVEYPSDGSDPRTVLEGESLVAGRRRSA